MNLRCYKCKYPWNYRGNKRGKQYLTCPDCLYKIRFDKAIVGNLPTILPTTNLPTIHNITPPNVERISFPDGFNCLIEKSIAHHFKDLPEELEIENGVYEYQKEYNNLFDFPNFFKGVTKQIFKELEENSKSESYNEIVFEGIDQFNVPTIIKETKNNQEIKVIPRDPIKLLEHQKEYGFFHI